jgi:hypothetical protein
VLLAEYSEDVYNGEMCSTAATLGFNAIGKTADLEKTPYVACSNGEPVSATEMRTEGDEEQNIASPA